jgi:DNA polymerase V
MLLSLNELQAQSVCMYDNEILENLLFNYDLFGACMAGFPSPADDFPASDLNLNDKLIKNPGATYFFKVEGDSMVKAGIRPGDLLIVDRAIEPTDNRIVIACLDGELIVKRIRMADGQLYLVPENDNYRTIKITEEMNFDIWGVVEHVIHKL